MRIQVSMGLWLAAALGAGGCAVDGSDGDEVGDGELDSFGGGKADSPVSEGSAEACRIGKLANLASFDELDDDVRLDRRAARNIVDHREGADGALDTDDDGWFSTLAGLDGVPYVGPKAFKALRKYATDHPAYHCGAVDVQLLAFNDFHGNLKPPSGSSGRIQIGPDPVVNVVDAGGAEYLATHLIRLATEAGPTRTTTIVAAGDIVGATPLLSAAFHDEPSIEAMNLLGLAVTSVGNHEFDHGSDELLRLQYGGCHPDDGCQDGTGFDGAAFPFLAANVIDEATEAHLLPPYTIRRYGGTRIGFIGLTLEGTPLVTTAAGVAGLRFLDEAETINALVPELSARGVHAIVVLIHEGGSQTGLYSECTGASGALLPILAQLDPAISVVVSGHTHKAYDCVIDGRVVTSAAHAGRIITDIDLTVDERTGTITAKDARNVIVSRDVAKDAAQTALISRYETLIAPIANRVIGVVTGDLTRTANPAGEHSMGDVIADAQLESGRAAGSVAAFMNPGGVRADILAATISGGEAVGQVTYGEAFAVQPFGNNLISLTITGAQLDTLLEQQWQLGNGVEKANMLSVSAGFSYTWTASAPLGARIDPGTIRLDGAVVDPTASYRITVNSFLAEGGDGFAVLKLGTARAPGAVDVDALEPYLAAHSPLAVPAATRVTRLP